MTLMRRSLTLIALRAVAGCEGTGDDKTGGSPAPLLLDSYELRERVVGDPVVRRVPVGLWPLRVEGIGVLPGLLRRPIAADPAMLERGGLAGRTVAVQASRVAARSLGALGTRAMPIASSASMRGLDGVQRRLGSYHEGAEVPRPQGWAGYLVRPASIEFWQGRPNRLRDRRDGEGGIIKGLAP